MVLLPARTFNNIYELIYETMHFVRNLIEYYRHYYLCKNI